jgi:hypothetical protein
VKTMVTPEEREAELRAAGKWPEEPALPTAPASMEPAQIAEAAAPAKTPQQAWMEELCGWRHRGPEDYYWGDAGNDTASVGYECLYKYDVLERAWGPLPWEEPAATDLVGDAPLTLLGCPSQSRSGAGAGQLVEVPA